MGAPGFLTAHAGVLVARLAGAPIAADGSSWPYLWAVSIGTAVYGWLALWLSADAARRLGLTRGVWLAVIGMAAASSLPVYQFFLPLHVHALSACAVAAFLSVWIVKRQAMDAGAWWLWGLVAGLMVQVYQLNGIILLVAIWQGVLEWRHRGLSTALAHGARFAVAGAVICLPQIVGKTMVYGSPLTTGYQDEFVWSSPRLWDTAFSANHGLLVWTPVVVLALIGLVRLLARRPELRVLGVVTLTFYVVVASYQNWHGQSSFGNRVFLSLTWVCVL